MLINVHQVYCYFFAHSAIINPTTLLMHEIVFFFPSLLWLRYLANSQLGLLDHPLNTVARNDGHFHANAVFLNLIRSLIDNWHWAFRSFSSDMTIRSAVANIFYSLGRKFLRCVYLVSRQCILTINRRIRRSDDPRMVWTRSQFPIDTIPW